MNKVLDGNIFKTMPIKKNADIGGKGNGEGGTKIATVPKNVLLLLNQPFPWFAGALCVNVSCKREQWDCVHCILCSPSTKRIYTIRHSVGIVKACHGWKLSYDRNRKKRTNICFLLNGSCEANKRARENGSSGVMSFEQNEIFTNAFEFNLLYSPGNVIRQF